MKNFKRYVVIEPRIFEKLKSDYAGRSNMTTFEKKMLSVLKNEKLSVSQRLAFYKLYLKQSLENDKKNTQFETYSREIPDDYHHKMTDKKFVRMIKPKKTLNTSSISIQTPKKSSTTEAKTSPFVAETPQKSSDIVTTSTVKKSSPQFMDAEEYIYDSDQVMEPVREDFESMTLEDDENDNIFDLSAERNELINEIKASSANPNIRIRDLKFKHLFDAEKDYFTAEDTSTGEQLLINKSEGIMEKLTGTKRKMNSRDITDAPQRKVMKISPRRLRSANRNLAKEWNNFEIL